MKSLSTGGNQFVLLAFFSCIILVSILKISVVDEPLPKTLQKVKYDKKQKSLPEQGDFYTQALTWAALGNSSCLYEFDVLSRRYSVKEENCPNVSVDALFDYEKHRLRNIWRLLYLDEDSAERGRKYLNKCFNEEISSEINDVVSMDIRSLKSVEYLIELLTEYAKYWPDARFVSTYSNEHSQTLHQASHLKICQLKKEDSIDDFLILSRATHHIMTDTTLSYILALYSRSSSRVIRDEAFCTKYSSACPIFWKSLSESYFRTVATQIPILDDELEQVIANEGLTINSARYKLKTDHILYKRFSGFLSYTRGNYESFPSLERFSCCENTHRWNKKLYGYPRCGKSKERECGVFREDEDKQLYCEAGGGLCHCVIPKKSGERLVWVGDKGGKTPLVDGEEFCKILGSRKVYIVGDSTMQQIVGVLANEILKQKGSCGNKIQILESDLLAPIHVLNVSKSKERFASIDKILPKIMELTKGKAVVVMTTGHHFGNYRLFSKMLKFVRNYMKFFKEKYNEEIERYQMKILWKSQAPSHSSCEKQTAHFLSPIQPLISIGNNTGKYEGYNRFVRFDLLSLGYLRQSEFDGFLDVSPLYNRPDAMSTGCTHFCLDPNDGTPLSDILNLLYQALKDEDSEKWLYQWD